MTKEQREKQLVAKEAYYVYGRSIGIRVNDLQRLMMLAKKVIKYETK